MADYTLREEQAGDFAPIHELTFRAFSGDPGYRVVEHKVVDILREDGDLVLSLVAVDDADNIVGHVAFSSAILSTGEQGWFALGPISVDPDRQGQGIGRALVVGGCARMRERGAKGIVLLGSLKLYSRFGFVSGTPLTIEGPHASYFQILPFVESIPDAQASFAPAFAKAYQESGT